MRVEDLDTPTLTIDLDALEENLDRYQLLFQSTQHWVAPAYQNAQDTCYCGDADGKGGDRADLSEDR